MLQAPPPIWRVQVPLDASEDRADRLLLPLLPEPMTRSQFHRLFDQKRVLFLGEAIPARSKLAPGACVEIHRPQLSTPQSSPKNIPWTLEVLYEDSDLAVIQKPAGVAVHKSPSRPHELTLVDALVQQIRDLSGIGGALRPGIVHRLDRHTSGALLVTKNDKAHLSMAEQFSQRKIHKTYLALCYGAFRETEVRMETSIGRSPKDRKKMTSLKTGGRRAISIFRPLEIYRLQGNPVASLMEVEIQTGRTHQIRVHASERQISVIGDPTYGVPSSRDTKWIKLPKEIRQTIAELPGQLLHAYQLTFQRPSDQQSITVQAPLPDSFLKTLAQFRATLEVDWIRKLH